MGEPTTPEPTSEDLDQIKRIKFLTRLLDPVVYHVGEARRATGAAEVAIQGATANELRLAWRAGYRSALHGQADQRDWRSLRQEAEQMSGSPEPC